MYQGVADILARARNYKKIHEIGNKEFRNLKERALLVNKAMEDHLDKSDEERYSMADKILQLDDSNVHRTFNASSSAAKGWKTLLPQLLLDRLPSRWQENPEESLRGAYEARQQTDAEFLQRLPAMIDKQPLLTEIATNALEAAHDYIRQTVARKVTSTIHEMRATQEKELMQQYKQEAQLRREQEEAAANADLIEAIRRKFVSKTHRLAEHPTSLKVTNSIAQ